MKDLPSNLPPGTRESDFDSARIEQWKIHAKPSECPFRRALEAERKIALLQQGVDKFNSTK